MLLTTSPTSKLLVTNIVVDIDESHQIDALSGMFHNTAQQVQDDSNSMLEKDDKPVNGTVKKKTEKKT